MTSEFSGDLQNLLILKDLFETDDMTYWLDSGTLIGLLRDNTLLKDDWDIDIGTWKSYSGDLREKLEENDKLQQLFEIRCYYWRFGVNQIILFPYNEQFTPIDIHLYNRSPEYKLAWVTSPAFRFTNEPEPPQDSEDDEKNSQIHKSSTAKISIRNWFFSKLWRFQENWLPKSVLEINWSTYVFLRLIYYEWGWYVPLRYFDELESTSFQGIEFPIPSYATDYLTEKYGNWRAHKENFDHRDQGVFYCMSIEQFLQSKKNVPNSKTNA